MMPSSMEILPVTIGHRVVPEVVVDDAVMESWLLWDEHKDNPLKTHTVSYRGSVQRRVAWPLRKVASTKQNFGVRYSKLHQLIT